MLNFFTNPDNDMFPDNSNLIAGIPLLYGTLNHPVGASKKVIQSITRYIAPK